MLPESITGKQQSVLQQWQEFEKEMDEKTKWFRQSEAQFRDQQLQATLPEKESQLSKLKSQRDEITSMEKDIDEFIDRSNALLHTSGVERLKPLISQISNRYQLLHVLSKEVINRWQTLVDYHRAYKDKYDEANKWLTPLEAHLEALKTDNLEAKNNRLRILFSEREIGESKITNVVTAGERLYPETAANGREIIRNELRQIRERWEKLEQSIREQQKIQDAQSVQWSTYQELLQQALAWLEQMEKAIQYDPNSSASVQDLKTKLYKLKTLAQEIQSYKRVIESVAEKAQVLESKESDPSGKINKRYADLVQNGQALIHQLEETVEIYNQFSDLQKSYQDYQKSQWDQLSAYSDYSGNKAALESRLGKVNEVLDNLPESNIKLQFLIEHVEKNKGKLPVRTYEMMQRDLNNLKFDSDKFESALRDLKHNLEERLQQWVDYETSLNRLLSWLADAETILKNYQLKATVEEKQEQLEKYQVKKLEILRY